MESEDLVKSAQSQHQYRLQCPVCERPVGVPANEVSKRSKFFPFCSERCKLIDLGAWLDADYRIASSTENEGEASPADSPSGPSRA